MNRNQAAAIASASLVVVVLILGFHALGGPRKQRLRQQDARTVQKIAELAQRIDAKWTSSNKTLPADLTSFPKESTEDPTTHQAFSYRRQSDTQYELCAFFVADTSGDQPPEPNGQENFWVHPKGEHCFPFDASERVLPAYYPTGPFGD